MLPSDEPKPVILAGYCPLFTTTRVRLFSSALDSIMASGVCLDQAILDWDSFAPETFVKLPPSSEMPTMATSITAASMTSVSVVAWPDMRFPCFFGGERFFFAMWAVYGVELFNACGTAEGMEAICSALDNTSPDV